MSATIDLSLPFQAPGRRTWGALALSVGLHVAIIGSLPGWNIQRAEDPLPLTVQLVIPPPPAPVVEQPRPEPKPVVRPEPVVRKAPPPAPRPEPKPVVQPAPEPEAVPAPVMALERPVEPAPAPAPAFTVPEVPPAAPRVETRPVTLAPPPPPKPRAIDPAALSGYGNTLSEALSRVQRYPRAAQLRGWQGIVELVLEISREGTVTGARVARSSGHDILDQRALEMVKEAALPAAPGGLRGNAFQVAVPVVFRLAG